MSVTIREFAQLIGKFVASEPGVMYAPLFYKTLEIQKDLELKRAKGNFESFMNISKDGVQCIVWWIHNLSRAWRPIALSKPNRIIESDSSSTGFGARDVTNSKVASGLWNGDEKLQHINFLELKAAFMALKRLCAHVTNEHVQLYLDNSTAIKYLSKMGGRKQDLNDLTRHVWLWCIKRNITLSVYHIPGKMNSHADSLSRQKLNSDMEWHLNRTIFNKIMENYGNCTVDLFASSQNHQIIPYVSYLPDDKALAINAFSINWANYFSYIFPPFSCYGVILQKLEEEQADAVMIAPIFSTQPWFPKLLQLTSEPPMILPRSNNLLTQPNSSSRVHPLGKMYIGVFRVSGKKYVTEAYHQSLPTLSCLPGDLVLKNSTGHISRSGCDFVVKGKLLHINHM